MLYNRQAEGKIMRLKPLIMLPIGLLLVAAPAIAQEFYTSVRFFTTDRGAMIGRSVEGETSEGVIDIFICRKGSKDIRIDQYDMGDLRPSTLVRTARRIKGCDAECRSFTRRITEEGADSPRPDAIYRSSAPWTKARPLLQTRLRSSAHFVDIDVDEKRSVRRNADATIARFAKACGLPL
jgi:hypothetical protein